MKKALVVAGAVIVMGMLQAIAASSVEQFRMGDIVDARFANGTGMQIDGLLLVFESPTELRNWVAVGGDLAPNARSDGEIRFKGWLVSDGEIYIDWLADGPRLTRASWLLEGEVVEDLCVDCPFARISISPGHPGVGEEVIFRSLSKDPSGSALAHQWEWKDGTTAEGELVTRRFGVAGDDEVTLTVRNEEGLTDQEVRRFSVCEAPEPEPEPEYFTLNVYALPYVGPSINWASSQYCSSVLWRVSGPGIDIEYLLEENVSPPPDTLSTTLAYDHSQDYASGTSVIISTEISATCDLWFGGIHWIGAAVAHGDSVTVIMDGDKNLFFTDGVVEFYE